MYLAAFLIITLAVVWAAPWLVEEIEKMKKKEVSPGIFSPNAIAAGTTATGVFFAALACLVFLITRKLAPSQQENGLVDAFLLNINHRQDFVMICAYAHMAGGLVLWIKAAFIRRANSNSRYRDAKLLVALTRGKRAAGACVWRAGRLCLD